MSDASNAPLCQHPKSCITYKLKWGLICVRVILQKIVFCASKGYRSRPIDATINSQDHITPALTILMMVQEIDATPNKAMIWIIGCINFQNLAIFGEHIINTAISSCALKMHICQFWQLFHRTFWTIYSPSHLHQHLLTLVHHHYWDQGASLFNKHFEAWSKYICWEQQHMIHNQHLVLEEDCWHPTILWPYWYSGVNRRTQGTSNIRPLPSIITKVRSDVSHGFVKYSQLRFGRKAI